MQTVKSYTQEYIDECRVKVNLLLSNYKIVSANARGNGGTIIDSFEPQFCNHMVLALDHYFMHRMKGLEGKDGNPLNELRILCDSLMNNNGKVSGADQTIQYDPDQSVLKYRVGDEINLNVKDFERLSKAFFAEIEKKFLA